MSAPFRFLGLALFAWVGVRAASLGYYPQATALAPPAKAEGLPLNSSALALGSIPGQATMGLTAPYPSMGGYYQPSTYAYPYPPMAYAPQPVVMPAIRIVQPHYPQPAAMRSASTWETLAPMPQPLEYAALDNSQWPVPTGITPAPSRPAGPAPVTPQRFDHWQFSAWGLMRNSPGASSLATNGMLGGSQGGARLTYRFNRHFAVSGRFSSALGGRRDAEAALGLRWQPFGNVPVALNVERRQGLGKWGGRSDFAAYIEGGLYQRKITGRLTLDAYGQAGMVGVKARDWFADGSLVASRPVWGKVSAGLGVWGGGQRDQRLGALYRIDAGPRLSAELRRGTRVHLDYRQRLVGNALPASGPTLTVASDF